MQWKNFTNSSVFSYCRLEKRYIFIALSAILEVP